MIAEKRDLCACTRHEKRALDIACPECFRTSPKEARQIILFRANGRSPSETQMKWARDLILANAIKRAPDPDSGKSRWKKQHET